MIDDKSRRLADPAARLAELREGKKLAEDVPLVAEEIEEDADESFSMRSADRRQKVMLEFRSKTGDSTAVAYSYLVRADLNPSEGITLDFSAYEVRIKGRNLRPLFTGIVAQRVASIQEHDELQAEVSLPSNKTVVTKIEVRTRE